MKKFFRALALVLALALVVGVVPAQTASAKAKAKKTLYVGGPQGASTTDDTLKSSYKARASIAKLAGLTKAQKKAGAKVTAKLVSGDSVTIGKKYIVAESFGKSIVEFSIDGKAVGQTVITCKKNADETTLTFDGLEDGQDVVAGLEYTVSLPRAGKDSDERRLFVEGEAVAEIEGKARQYAVKFTEVGKTYTLKAESFQSTNLDKATCAAEITVKCVSPKTVEAEQLTATSFAVTFSTAITGLIEKEKIENQNIYYMIADEPVVTGVIKSIDYDEEDPTKVVITMFSKFLDDVDYYFVYGDNEPVKFHSASNKLSEVAKLELIDAGAYYVGVDGIAIKYRLLNSKGIELSINEVPTFTVESDVAWIVGTNNIYFFEEGTAVVKASLETGYNEETYEPITVGDTLKVTGVTREAAVVTSKTYSFDGVYSHEKHAIRLKGADGTLQVKFTYSYGDPVVVNSTDAGVYIMSTDETVVVTIGNKVSAVKKGSATIVLYSVGTDGVQGTSDDYVVAAFPITVDDQNRGASATATLSQGTLNINTGLTDGAGVVALDSAKLTITIKDLDGNAYSDVTTTIEQVKNNKEAVGIAYAPSSTGTHYLAPADFTVFDATKFANNSFVSTAANLKTARVSFTVKVVDNFDDKVLCNTTLNLVVANVPEAAANSWKLKTTAATLDVSAKNYGQYTQKTSAVFTLDKTRTSGYGDFYCGGDSWKEIETISGIAVTASAESAQNYVLRTFPKKNNANSTINVTNSTNAQGDLYKVTVERFTVDTATSKAAVTALKGQYSLTGYRIIYEDNNNKTSDGYEIKSKTGLASAVTTVNQNDVKATVVIADGKAQTLRDNGLNINSTTGEGTFTVNNNVFIVNWDGLDSKNKPARVALTGKMKAKVDETTTAVYVYSVEAQLFIDDADTDLYFLQDVPVNRLFKDNY